MKILSFKNGDKIKISDTVAYKLYERIVLISTGAKEFQFFTSEEDGTVLLAIKLSEISYISSQENII